MDNHFCDKFLVHDSLYNLEILDYPVDIIQPTRKRDFYGLYEELAGLSEGCVIEIPKSLWRIDE